MDPLIQQLCQADRIVGFNIYCFDFTVLQPYTPIPLHQLPHLDLLRDIEGVLGHRVRLDNYAHSTLGICKAGDGVQAVRWLRKGHIERVIQYCQQDVEILVRLHEYGRQNGHVCYVDRYGEIRRVFVNW